MSIPPSASSEVDHESQAPRQSLWPVYYAAEAYEFLDPPRAYSVIDHTMQRGFENYTAPRDLWHNFAMVAARVRHMEAELALVQAGLVEWPDSVDLLCDELQLRHSTQYDPLRAEELWQKLWTMDRTRTAPFWRFWVYGAIYHVVEKNDRTTALQLLDQGLCSARRDSLMDILRSYRRVLVDSGPVQTLTLDHLHDFQRECLAMLEQRYLQGIDLGVENGYVLAIELARLYQECARNDLRRAPATTEDACSPDSNSVLYPDRTQKYLLQGSLPRPEGSETNRYLEKALDLLDLAEQLYIGSTNHPVWGIYIARARILMAQHRYGEALKFLSAIPSSQLDSDPSLKTMRNLASLMTGEDPANLWKAESEGKQQSTTQGTLSGAGSQELATSKAETILETLGVLLADDGALLKHFANEFPQVRETIVALAADLAAGKE